jgi:Spy/CpxP family protein refolding chaperone
MMIRFTKQFFAFLLVVGFTFCFPEISTALVNSFSVNSVLVNNSFSDSQVILIANQENTKESNIFEIDLTPQERQKIQAIRQRRNRDILAILDENQRQDLASSLHQGSKFYQAISELNLSSEQRDLIKAIFDFTNSKVRAISVHNDILE